MFVNPAHSINFICLKKSRAENLHNSGFTKALNTVLLQYLGIHNAVSITDFSLYVDSSVDLMARQAALGEPLSLLNCLHIN